MDSAAKATTAGQLPAHGMQSGLDLQSPDTISAEERSAFRDFYDSWKGEQLAGHVFLLEHRPDALKRYFREVRAVSGDRVDVPEAVGSLGHVHLYAVTGWSDGIRQHAHLLRGHGVPWPHFLDVLTIAALHAGPRGMHAVAGALGPAEAEWAGTPTREAANLYPASWPSDPALLASGVDFDRPDLDDDEVDMLFAWYDKYAGGPSPSLVELVRTRPRVVKAFRDRFEHTIAGGLPIPMLPYCLLQLNLFWGRPAAIRTYAHMCLALGMSMSELIGAAVQCTYYGGIDTVAQLYEHGGIAGKLHSTPSKETV